MSAYNNSLRPAFTEHISNLLEKNRSINIFGLEGSGRKRLLDDIKKNSRVKIKTVIVNMKSYKESYAGLIDYMSQLLCVVDKKPKNLSELIDCLDFKDQKIFILLHNFDALLDNPSMDSLYDIEFFNALNYIKSKEYISLVCVTLQPHDQSVIIINGKDKTSWLDLEKKPLPELSYEEIKNEIFRQDLPVHEEFRLKLAENVWHEKRAYQFLVYCINEIVSNVDGSEINESNIVRWQKAFRAEIRKRNLNIRGVSKIKRILNAWSIVTGFEGIKKPLQIFRTVGSLINSILNKYSKEN